MPIPTPPVSTELDAVNQILSSVGQAPVTTLDMQNPEVFIVIDTLRSTNRELQMQGWTFNTERHLEYTPRVSDKRIKYPLNVLELDANKQHHGDKYDIVRRDGFMYDRHNHTFEFTENVVCDAVFQINFEDAPPTFQAYVINKAARLCAVKMVGDKELFVLLEQQENDARTAFLDYDTRQGDYNMFGFRDGEDYYISYQPFKALTR